MRIYIPCTALGLALVAAAPAANAQTVLAVQPVQTVRTVRTVETVRTVRPAAHIAARHVVHRHVVTTRQTTVSERIIPAPAIIPTQTVIAPVAAGTYSQPLYDEVAPEEIEATSVYPRGYDYQQPPYDYAQRPLYDEVSPAPVAAPYGTMPVADESIVNPAIPVAPGMTPPLYRYVYEPGRILVIDPSTNIAVQAIRAKAHGNKSTASNKTTSRAPQPKRRAWPFIAALSETRA